MCFRDRGTPFTGYLPLRTGDIKYDRGLYRILLHIGPGSVPWELMFPELLVSHGVNVGLTGDGVKRLIGTKVYGTRPLSIKGVSLVWRV